MWCNLRLHHATELNSTHTAEKQYDDFSFAMLFASLPPVSLETHTYSATCTGSFCQVIQPVHTIVPRNIFLFTHQVNFLFLEIYPGHLPSWWHKMTIHVEVEMEMELVLLESMSYGLLLCLGERLFFPLFILFVSIQLVNLINIHSFSSP